MILLATTDFDGGKYDLPDSTGIYTEPDLQAAIDAYEEKYIYQLLGVTLGDLIIAYLAASRSPTNTEYDMIIDAFSEDDNHCIVQSLGMKEYLKAAIFYEYTKNSLVTSQAGVVDPQSETATKQSPMSVLRFAENKFNDVLDTVDAIQWYCSSNSSSFPDFNGQRITVKIFNLI
jgi:hypothetical protein